MNLKYIVLSKIRQPSMYKCVTLLTQGTHYSVIYLVRMQTIILRVSGSTKNLSTDEKLLEMNSGRDYTTHELLHVIEVCT